MEFRTYLLVLLQIIFGMLVISPIILVFYKTMLSTKLVGTRMLIKEIAGAVCQAIGSSTNVREENTSSNEEG